MNPDEIARLMQAAGLGAPLAAAPLAGGVSCDTWHVRTADGEFVLKRALPQLRTAMEWHAPVSRMGAEAAWFRRVAALLPGAVPEVIAELPAEHALVTRFLPPETAPVWKAELIAGRVDPVFADAVGRTLARIHAATTDDPAILRDFAHAEAFHALRIEPFLLVPAERHPAAAPVLRALAADLGARREALVHGDASPKNILVAPHGPVFLDAETAVAGDPAFDGAFCLAHLLLKAAWLAPRRAVLLEAARAFLAGLAPPADRDRRIAHLASALLLARVDGRSPADYLRDAGLEAAVREQALALLADLPQGSAELVRRWGAQWGQTSSR